MLKLIAVGILLLHGLGHGGALAALAWIRANPGSDTGAWLAARSWLIAPMSSDAATVLASAFWVVSLVGFVAAAVLCWGIGPDGLWRPVAVASAVISIVGIVLFLGTWPVANTVAALAVDIGVLVAILWLRWPSEAALAG